LPGAAAPATGARRTTGTARRLYVTDTGFSIPREQRAKQPSESNRKAVRPIKRAANK
jgi:hypothetical protein